MFLESLYKSFTISNQLSIVEGEGGFPLIKIDNQHAIALISIYGAQVLSYRPKSEQKDLLFVSDKAYFKEGKAIKGGIPICWPWFGQDQEKIGKQMHGFARKMLWKLEETSSLENGEIAIVLSLNETQETQKLWPHEFKLTLTIKVGELLKLSLKTVNTGDSAFIVTQALHTYFAIDDVHQTKIHGLDKVTYIDKVGGKSETKLQINDLPIEQEVDRIYTDVPAELGLSDESTNRKVSIKSKASKTAIVWNPWIAISKESGDLADDAYRQFVCIETANAVEDKVIIEPSESHTLEAVYSITGA